jgi:hypothetical protein
MCSPRVFPIAPNIKPICFPQNLPLLTYIAGVFVARGNSPGEKLWWTLLRREISSSQWEVQSCSQGALVFVLLSFGFRVHKLLAARMQGILSTYHASSWQQTVRNGHSPYKGASSPCNWHSRWALRRHKLRLWKLLAFICLNPVFTHGQLYVALSRATCVNDVFVFCPNGKMTTNVVYTKLLQWCLFSIYCMFFSLNESEFPHPNHELKFPAKMAATKAAFTTCNCWKQNAS